MRLNRVSACLLAAFCIGGSTLAIPALAQQAAQVSPAWGLSQLMLALKRVKAASGRFIERKTLHMLSAPLVSSGTLTYVAPDHMQKVTLSPKPQRFVLDGDHVTISGGADQQSHTFLLTDYPQIAGLVEGVQATLAGDLPRLSRFYVVHLSGNAADWQLQLQPKGAALARFVKQIRILGSQDRIHEIDTEESNGDHSEMSVTEDVRYAR
jgi:hypothetical protein